MLSLDFLTIPIHIMSLNDNIEGNLTEKPQNGFSKMLLEKVFNTKTPVAANDLFYLVIEHLPDQIYIKDTMGHFILCNKAVAINAGCHESAELIGKTDFDFYPPEDAEQFYLDEQSIMNSSVPLVNHEEHFVDKKTNELKWNLTTKIPLKDDTGTIVGLLGINRDITQRKTALLEREKIMANLVQRNKDLEQFTYIVSHNLRLPAANILGLLALVHEGTVDAETDIETVLNGISNSAKKLDTIIHDLNAILQIRETADETKTLINLEQLVAEVTQSIENLLAKEQVRIECQFEITHIVSIQGYLFSMFYHLILKGIKYRAPDVSPVITIRSSIHENAIQLVFSDNGKGINLETTGSQLGMYGRFGPAVEGKGIGLYIIKMQVELLNGTINIQSEPGKGTTFTILLPFSQ